MAFLIARRRIQLNSPQLEVTALYWSLVDIVWIVAYPLLYLGSRA
jgi:cytochrome c oxidase subunit III